MESVLVQNMHRNEGLNCNHYFIDLFSFTIYIEAFKGK